MPWLIQDRLLQIEFAFNYWNISAYLLKKWIYYYEIIMLRNNSVNYFEFWPTFDKDCLHFWKCDASAPLPWWIPIWRTKMGILEPFHMLSYMYLSGYAYPSVFWILNNRSHKVCYRMSVSLNKLCVRVWLCE